MSGPRIAYVVGTYPLPTTTFIDREVRQLRAMGIRVEPISLRRPTRLLSESQRELEASVTYVLPASIWQVARSQATFLLRRPGVYLKTLASLVSRPHPDLASRVRTVGHVALGVHVARLLRDRGPFDRVHAHFVDRAAVVALVAGRLLDLPYSATAHANDIYVRPVLLPEKLSGATFVATCTRYNERHLRSVAPDAAIRCLYHGLDLDGFDPDAGAGAGAGVGVGADRARPLLLSVAQLKEKKGLGYLVEACRILTDRGLDVEVEVVGEGPLREPLEAQALALGVADRVRFSGALPHDQVVARYAAASAFVLPCVTASDGDRDGIPNVILEAMAMGLPVVSTRHSGIPEAVEDGETGVLVEPGDATALADALEGLLADPDRGDWMGAAGRRRVEKVFDVEVNVRRLAEGFRA